MSLRILTINISGGLHAKLPRFLLKFPNIDVFIFTETNSPHYSLPFDFRSSWLLFSTQYVAITIRKRFGPLIHPALIASPCGRILCLPFSFDFSLIGVYQTTGVDFMTDDNLTEPLSVLTFALNCALKTKSSLIGGDFNETIFPSDR